MTLQRIDVRVGSFQPVAGPDEDPEEHVLPVDNPWRRTLESPAQSPRCP